MAEVLQARPPPTSAAIEPARIILGHRSAAITELYAEKDEQQAVAAMMKVG